MKSLARRVLEIERSPFYAIKDYALSTGRKDLIYLNVGEPDFKTPRHIIDAAKRALDEGFTHYTGDKGLLELRRLVAERLKAERGVNLSPENIIITVGCGEANFVALMTLVDEGDEVLVPSPYYPPYNMAVKLAGGLPVKIQLKEELDFQWDIEEVRQKITDRTKLAIICSPNNPTGGVFDEELLKQLANLAVDHDFYILSDEVYDSFVYDGEYLSIASAAEHDISDRLIITNSFSKTYAMTGWRVGFIAGPKHIIQNALKVHYAATVSAPSISQAAAIAALLEDDKCVKEMVAEYDKRRRYLVNELNKIPGFRCKMPRGAFYAFPNISAFNMRSEDFAKFLVREAGVVTVHGSAFGEHGEGYLRISYASSMSELREAITRIRKAAEKLEISKS